MFEIKKDKGPNTSQYDFKGASVQFLYNSD